MGLPGATRDRRHPETVADLSALPHYLSRLVTSLGMIMSMHRFAATTHCGISVDVETGWDAETKGYFLVVKRSGAAANDDWDESELFSTSRLARSMQLPSRYEPLQAILEGMGIPVPSTVLGECLVDQMLCVNW
jgi:hypothetical protein